MIDWDAVKNEYNRLTNELGHSSNEVGQKHMILMQKKIVFYRNILNLHDQMVDLSTTLTNTKKEAEFAQDQMQSLFEEEIDILQKKYKNLEEQLEEKLYKQDVRDERSIFLEIRAGTGGQEAALFAADLFKTYNEYALAKGWRTSVIDFSKTDIGGYKEMIVHIEGKNVYKYLKFESGVHRVQRVPKTETAGRVHTSTVTVAVVPEAKELEVSINPSELRVDVYRSSGAGGQHVNTTDSAVRITHIPTGLVVTCQDERSQLKNKAKALKVLQSRLYEEERNKREQEERKIRKQLVGSGERAEKIRTYNFPQNRVTDHRVGITLKKLDRVMLGDLDDLVFPLLEKEKSESKIDIFNPSFLS